MKKLILLAALVSFIKIAGYSQNFNQFKIDTTFRNITGSIDKFSMNKPQEYSSLLNGKEGNKSLFPESQKLLALTTNPVNRVDKARIDNMPIVDPDGNFSTRIYKPDSTVRYSLQIKKLNQIPLKR